MNEPNQRPQKAVKVGDREKFFPIPKIKDWCYAFRQRYEIPQTSVAPLALNTVSPDDPTAFLQKESNLIHRLDGMAEFTRTYYQIPLSWEEFEIYTTKFPQPGFGHDIFPPPGGIESRVHRDYFMVGPGQTFDDAEMIPIPIIAYELFSARFLTREIHLIWIANAQAHGWSTGRVGTMDTNPGQFVVESCKSNLVGNIWERMTRYVLAQ